MSAVLPDSELKARHRAMWASGDYPQMVETFLTPLGPRLVDACRIGPGMRVLDVASGTGNAAIPAAQRGAEVVASDLTPELFEAGRRRAADAGVELQWAQADAEHLPFEDESFDVVISSIGVMFAPHHQEAADELVRVCRPGGTIGLLSWTPEGMLGAFFRTMRPFMAPPPPGAQPAPLWGSEDHVHQLFGERVGFHTIAPRGSRDHRVRERRTTTPRTSRPTTARRSPPARTRRRRAARPSSTRRWTTSATSGTAARPTRRASSRST